MPSALRNQSKVGTRFLCSFRKHFRILCVSKVSPQPVPRPCPKLLLMRAQRRDVLPSENSTGMPAENNHAGCVATTTQPQLPPIRLRQTHHRQSAAQRFIPSWPAAGSVYSYYSLARSRLDAPPIVVTRARYVNSFVNSDFRQKKRAYFPVERQLTGRHTRDEDWKPGTSILSWTLLKARIFVTGSKPRCPFSAHSWLNGPGRRAGSAI